MIPLTNHYSSEVAVRSLLLDNMEMLRGTAAVSFYLRILNYGDCYTHRIHGAGIYANIKGVY